MPELIEAEMISILISMSSVINKRLQQLNKRLDELEKTATEQEKAAEREFGEGTPAWVPEWLDEIERNGKMEELCNLAEELFGNHKEGNID